MAKTSRIVSRHRDEDGGGHTIGASEIAAVFGLDPWRTRLDLYLKKWRGVEVEQTEPMRWGLLNEYHILQVYAQETGHYVLGMDLNEEPCLFRPNDRPVWSRQKFFKEIVSKEHLRLITHTCQHPDAPWLTCHPDGLEFDPDGKLVSLVQAKNMSAYASHDDGLPVHYALQAHHELCVVSSILALDPFDLDHTTVCFVGGNKLLTYSTERDPSVESNIVSAAAEFVQRLEDGNPPPPTADKRGADALGQLYAGEDETPLLIRESDRLFELLERLEALRQEADEVDVRRQEVEVMIREEMGEHTTAHDIDKTMKVVWSPQRQKETVDWKAVSKELTDFLDDEDDLLDELAEKHTRQSKPFRSFRVTFSH